ncbi:hypothetical protein B0H34DRAFT_676958 [Crassisporium funariophilum]|nr:hypothetical protein B0H34DRAFT_676958 [Crassisporium funariophilum]
MTESHQTSPIIPVIDERLGYDAKAPKDHKLKVEQYNDLLEDIYQREVELTKIKSALIAMRTEIDEDVRHMDGTSTLPREVVKFAEEETEAEKDKDAESLSDSSDKGKKDKKSAKKAKAKGSKGSKKSRISDSELDAEWDYKLELSKGSSKRERRASNASDVEVEMIPLRAKVALSSH